MSTEKLSPEYEEFLEFLGEKIQLKGWDKYRGGLDVKSKVFFYTNFGVSLSSITSAPLINKDDTTGTHSIYTVHCGLSIMFHVATMIPFTAGDEQQVERKRHLGNDIVVIVF